MEIELYAKEEAEAIRRLLGKTAENLIEIGHRLIRLKERIPHGEWGSYLAREFDWNERSAQRLMGVARCFNSDNLSGLRIGPSALYLLASSSTPEPVRAEMLERAKAGETITHSEVKAAIEAQAVEWPSFQRILSRVNGDRWEAQLAFIKTCSDAGFQLWDIIDRMVKHPECNWREWPSAQVYAGISDLTEECFDEWFRRISSERGYSFDEIEERLAKVVRIDLEFSTMLPPLTPDQFQGLEQSILVHGCRDRLKVWKGHRLLLDGHQRYTICLKHGLPFQVREVELPSREEAMRFIWGKQAGRKNLTPDEESYLRGKRELLTLERKKKAIA